MIIGLIRLAAEFMATYFYAARSTCIRGRKVALIENCTRSQLYVELRFRSQIVLTRRLNRTRRLRRDRFPIVWLKTYITRRRISMNRGLHQSHGSTIQWPIIIMHLSCINGLVYRLFFSCYEIWMNWAIPHHGGLYFLYIWTSKTWLYLTGTNIKDFIYIINQPKLPEQFRQKFLTKSSYLLLSTQRRSRILLIWAIA